MIRRMKYHWLLFRARPIEKTLKLLLISISLYIFFRTMNYVLRRPSYYITIYTNNKEKIELGIRDYTPRNFTETVVLLHSENHDSRVWEDIGTLDTLNRYGYRALAIDLPEYGYSYLSKAPSMYYEKAALLQNVLEKLKIISPILVVSGQSGVYGMPLLVRGKHLKFKGFVGIAPFFTEKFSQVEYSRVQVPTLIMYGEKDTDFKLNSLPSLSEIPGVKVNVILDTKRDCYVYKKDEFHVRLIEFLESLK